MPDNGGYKPVLGLAVNAIKLISEPLARSTDWIVLVREKAIRQLVKRAIEQADDAIDMTRRIVRASSLNRDKIITEAKPLGPFLSGANGDIHAVMENGIVELDCEHATPPGGC
jgi:hypothetical protein